MRNEELQEKKRKEKKRKKKKKKKKKKERERDRRNILQILMPRPPLMLPSERHLSNIIRERNFQFSETLESTPKYARWHVLPARARALLVYNIKPTRLTRAEYLFLNVCMYLRKKGSAVADRRRGKTGFGLQARPSSLAFADMQNTAKRAQNGRGRERQVT